MTEQDTAVRIEVSVDAPIDRAFTLFVERIGSWWPRTHSVTDDMVDVVMEARPGGRLYERGRGGTECQWGTVVAVDAPHHVAFTWSFTPGWQPSSDPDRASRVDVRFTGTNPNTTTVVLVHSELERHGQGWETLRESVSGDNGWSAILVGYTDLAATHFPRQ